MQYQEIKDLKTQVKHCLENIPATRDSDITLTIEIWKAFYPKYVRQGKDGDWGVWLNDLYILPREDNVKRARAYWQNTKKMYPPSTWEIAKKRSMLEDDWRVAMGYPTKESSGTEQPSWGI